MAEAMERIAADLQALTAVPERYAGTEGERAMLHAVRARLPEGVAGRIEAFVDHISPALWSGVHAALLLLAGAGGYWHPGIGALACFVVTLSLLGEGLGRFRLMRWWAPRTPAYNLAVKHPMPEVFGTIILTTPLDSPRWRPQSRRWVSFRPMQIEFGAAMLVTFLLVLRFLAEPWGKPSISLYLAALAVLAGSVVVGALAHRASSAIEEASGPVTLLELTRRFNERPVPGLQVWTVWTACGRAYQGGMRAFLELHGPHLPSPALVIALDEAGRQPLYAVTSEGQLIPQSFRSTGPALVERLRWAGHDVPVVSRGTSTDARVAMIKGYRAISFLGGESEATPQGVIMSADLIEQMVRMYGEDLQRLVSKRQLVQLPEEAKVVESS